MEQPFKNKKILLSGAGGALGSVLSRVLTQQGAVVAGLIHRRPAPGDLAFSASVDFTRHEQISPAIRDLEEKLGGIDILINNAGSGCDGLLPSLSEEEIQDTLDANLTGTLLACRAVLPGFVSGKSGCILNISSLAAIHPLAGQSVYAAAKAGLEGLTRALAVEYAGRNIRVNALAPGFLDSPMLAALSGENRNAVLKTIPLARWGSLEETAEAALFLCSEKASYITGQIFRLDGGVAM